MEFCIRGHELGAQRIPSLRCGQALLNYDDARAPAPHERRYSVEERLHLGVDPGTMNTGLQRHASWLIRVLMFKIVLPLMLLLMSYPPFRSTQKSASHILRAAFDSNEVLGEYPKDLYLNGDEPWETSEESRDAQKRELVWKGSVRYTQMKEGETVLAA